MFNTLLPKSQFHHFLKIHIELSVWARVQEHDWRNMWYSFKNILVINTKACDEIIFHKVSIGFGNKIFFYW
jgi:hypothetical protein